MPGQSNQQDAAAQQALRLAVEHAAREAETARAHLLQLTTRFNTAGQHVMAIVGGSAQSIDQKLANSLQEAVRSTNFAVSALGTVATAARSVS